MGCGQFNSNQIHALELKQSLNTELEFCTTPVDNVFKCIIEKILLFLYSRVPGSESGQGVPETVKIEKKSKWDFEQSKA